ncbi:hypothetical protein BH24ACT21_BH24ACT21_08000 [soil metagenome]|jgi:hypothetical protein
MEKQIPKSWVGEDILLARTGAAESELVNIEEVNETGVAYSYKAGEMSEVPIFIPWSAVSWMRPSIPDDLQESGDDTENGEE